MAAHDLGPALGLIAQFAERMGLEITEGIDVNVWSRSHQVREGGEVIEEWRHGNGLQALHRRLTGFTRLAYRLF